MWPNAKFIHIVRDPRDVAKSFIKMGWSGNVWCGADRWVKAEEALENVKKVVLADRWIELKYERLISNPEEELKKICGFIAVPYSSDRLTYYKTSTFDKPMPELAYRWKRTLSKFEIRLVESRALTALLDRGYEQSGLPHMRLSLAYRQILLAENKIAVIYSGIRIYGFMLYALLFVTRKLRLKKLYAWAMFKRNKIAVKYLK